jgi:arylsulfatase A-like enzyme
LLPCLAALLPPSPCAYNIQAIHSPDEVPQSYRDPFNSSIPDTPDSPSKVLNNTGNHRRTVAGMVAALDEGVGNVTAALKAAGMWEDTLIFFTADNGGPAAGFNSNMASNWPLRGMKVQTCLLIDTTGAL